MALALKKKKEDEEAAKSTEAREKLSPSLETSDVTTEPQHTTSESEKGTDERGSDERGRRIDKGKARVRVVGFDGANQDGLEEEE